MAEYSINHDSKAIQDLYTFSQNKKQVLYIRILIYFIEYNCNW